MSDEAARLATPGEADVTSGFGAGDGDAIGEAHIKG